jgi:rare lipoprotein A
VAEQTAPTPARDEDRLAAGLRRSTLWRMKPHELALTIALAMAVGGAGPASAATATKAQPGQGEAAATPSKQRKLDHSGRKQVGKASYYARKFAGRKMADGTPMNPRDDNAASKTLPLGTTARVTNLETGRSAKVTIQDRGPYVPGRIVDLSPATAEQIGITREEGIAQVEVAPIAVPQPDGGVKGGAGAR